MASYYANIDNAYTGTGHAGTTIDPFSFADLISHSSIYTYNNVYYLKGSQDSPSSSLILYVENNTWDAWDLATNGPWRIHNTATSYPLICLNTTYQLGAIKNGIISFGYLTDYFPNCYDMVIVNTAHTTFEIPNTVVSGCTIYCVKTHIKCNVVFKDCVFGSNIDLEANNSTLVNCVYNVMNMGSYTTTLTNCQSGWSSPTPPAWNSPQSSFSSSTLSVGINTPPEPGNSPYTGYNNGLWNSPRSGIGAMDFPLALSITTQPLSQAVALGGTLNLSIGAVGGSGSYTYQWKKDSTNVQDATYSTYSKNNFAKSDAGFYKSSVSDGTTTIISNDATVNYSLMIDTQPLSQTVSLGGTLNLSVTVSGGFSPYTYQWKKGTGNITDATFSSYTKTDFAKSDATTYNVLVNDSTGSSLLSNGAVINYPLMIDTQPDSTTVSLGSLVLFSVGVSGGSGSYTYQWQKNTGDISGAVNSTYTINSVLSTDAGTYRVSIYDGTSTLVSNNATLVIASASTKGQLLDPVISYISNSSNSVIEIPSGRVKVLYMAGLTIINWWDIID